MRALLLAGGFGTRLRPITDTIPKCLVPIQGRPLIDYWFDLLFLRPGVERALVNTHYLAETVRAHVAKSLWRDRIDLVHENELLGTGGTIVANKDYFQDGDFIVAHADNLTDVDVVAMLNAHAGRPADTAMTMLAFRSDDPSSCGILECDPQGRVLAFHEKVPNPPGNLANAAVYVMTPEVVAAAVAVGTPFVDLSTQVIPNFVGRIYAVATRGYHRDIGNPTSLARAEAEFRPGARAGVVRVSEL